MSMLQLSRKTFIFDKRNTQFIEKTLGLKGLKESSSLVSVLHSNQALPRTKAKAKKIIKIYE